MEALCYRLFYVYFNINLIKQLTGSINIDLKKKGLGLLCNQPRLRSLLSFLSLLEA